MQIKLSDFEKTIVNHPELRFGCVVDTNILFAYSYPLDIFNEWAEKVIHILHRLEVPIYTNLTVRSEFLDLNRRVLIPEGLIDFYEELEGAFDNEVISMKLKSLKARKNNAEIKEKRTFKFSDSDIKEFMDLLNGIDKVESETNWTLFCRDYYSPYIANVWDDAVKDLKLKFLGMKEIEGNKDFFDKKPSWKNMVSIMGLSGISSSDAMIVNLFQESKIPLLITTDNLVRDTLLEFMPKNKFVLAP